jgi:predicted ATPase
MLSRIHQLVEACSQFVIATHSPIILAYPNSKMYQIGIRGIEQVTLEDTEHYAVARRFLNDPRGQIAKLLDSAPDETKSIVD